MLRVTLYTRRNMLVCVLTTENGPISVNFVPVNFAEMTFRISDRHNSTVLCLGMSLINSCVRTTVKHSYGKHAYNELIIMNSKVIFIP